MLKKQKNKQTKEGDYNMSKTLSERMIEYRAVNRLSQTALAQKCGVTLQTINSVENGIQKPSKLTKAKIELVIGKEDATE